INVDATEDFDNNPIGTGPFKIGSFNLKNTSYLDKYNDYWKGEPKLNNIKIIHVSDADTLTMAMQTGEIDVAQGVPYSSVSLFEDESLYKISSIDTSRMILMYYNYENKFLNDKNLRKAISMSINKPEYTSVLLKDSASYAKGPFPEGMKCGGKSINVDDYNADEARRILKDAGYEDNDNDGILEKNSEKLELKLITYSSRAELPILAQAIQSDLKDIGINVSVEVSDNIMDILNNSKFDICLYSNVTAPTGDSYAYLNNLVRSSGASNYGQYKNEESEKFLDLMESELDKEMRDNLAIKIIQNTIDDNGFDFIAHLKMKFIMKSNVVNFDIHQTDYYQIN
ncbi:MAG: ABC transporter substrate-binding protein, partial [Clostridium butyricum]